MNSNHNLSKLGKKPALEARPVATETRPRLKGDGSQDGQQQIGERPCQRDPHHRGGERLSKAYGLTGTGLAQPKPANSNSSEPITSRWARGLSVRRPFMRGRVIAESGGGPGVGKFVKRKGTSKTIMRSDQRGWIKITQHTNLLAGYYTIPGWRQKQAPPGRDIMRSMLPDLKLEDHVRLRKPHPCGGYDWKIYRLGADIGLECLRCGRRVLLPRRTLAQRLKSVLPKEESA